MDPFIIYYALPAPRRARVILTIPAEDASRFSTRPLKWIRYATGALLGAEGDLQRYTEGGDRRDNSEDQPDDNSEDQRNDNSEDQPDNTIDLEDVAPHYRQLLFVPNGPIRYIDRDGLNHLKSSNFTTESRTGFKATVEARDEGNCIITGHPSELCEGCHLIPHSKGNQYIQDLCRWRNIYDDEEITDINDVRNGLLVDVSVHRLYTLNYLAVLRTPNFALAVDEVLPNSSEHHPAFRFTPHYFAPHLASQTDMYKKDLHYPANLVDEWPEDWPPAFLWDFIYGVIISREYGIEATDDILNEKASRHYYPQGIKTSTDRACAEIARRKQERERRINEQREARDERARNRGAQDYSDAFDRVFCHWMYHRFGPLGQKARVQEEADLERLKQERHNSTIAKVATWREEMGEGVN